MQAGRFWQGVGAGVALGVVVAKAARARRRISFAGKRVIVSGGSRGLGLVMARVLAQEGARVALLARDPEELARAKADVRAIEPQAEVLTIVCDVAHQLEVTQSVEQVVSAWGGVDVVFNVAGVIQVGPWEHMKTKDFEEALDVHLWGPLNMMRAVMPHMLTNGFGRIVNVASVGGTVGLPHMLPYAASKAALINLSSALSAEVSRYGIRVSVAVPGLIRTGSHVNARFKGHHEQEYAWFASAESMPVLSVSAERAAKQIIGAGRYGDYHVAIGWPARLAEIANGLAPNLTARALSCANRAMPEKDGHAGEESRSGWNSRDPEATSTRLLDRKGSGMNQGEARNGRLADVAPAKVRPA